MSTPKSILIISGHKNIPNITALGLRKWRAWSSLRASTGASGEMDWLWDKLMPLLKDRLIAKGFQVFITDAIYHEETYNRDYDLCLAIHYDAGGTDSRCIISKPRQSITPPFITPEASLLADQFISAWLGVYPQVTGITSRQDRITEGMTDYYCWDYVKEGTPSVIIEHGNNTCPYDHDKMFNHPDLIADANIEAIVKFFQPTAPPPIETANETTIELYKRFVEDLIEFTRPPNDKRGLPELAGWIKSVKQQADNTQNLQNQYDSFVKKVAGGIGCSDDSPENVLAVLQGLVNAHNSELLATKKKKLMEFSKADLVMGLFYKFFRK